MSTPGDRSTLDDLDYPTDRRLRGARGKDGKLIPPKLSDRERQLVTLAASGHTDTAIAQELGISEATVGTYWGRIRVKLGPYSRTELVSIVIKADQAHEMERLKEANGDLVRQLKLGASELGGLYRSLIETAADSMLLTSAMSTIIDANRAAHELFGYEAGELVGQSLDVLVPERFREAHAKFVTDYVEDPQRGMMGDHLLAPALRKDGTEIRIQAALSALATPSGILIMSVHRLASAVLVSSL